MGILAALRRTVADAISAAVGPEPLNMQLISGPRSADTVYQGFRGGCRVIIQRDYPSAPWSWTVETGSGDARLVGFRGNVESYDAAVLSVSEWLATDDGKRACQAARGDAFDGTPRAA